MLSKIASLYISLSLVCIACFGQEINLGNLGNTFQAQHNNPALAINKKVHISLPSVGMDLRNTGFTYRDLVTENTLTNRLILDPGGIIGKLDPNNYMHFRMHADVLGLALKFKTFQINAHVATKTNASLDYTKDLVQLAWEGNSNTLGRTLSLAPDFQLSAYHEIGIGGSMNLSPRLRLGTKIKYLVGLANISTGRSSVQLTTANDYYQLSGVVDYEIRASMIDLPLNDQEFAANIEPFGPNKGIAIDIGAAYEVNKQLELAASLIDLGKLNWNNQSETHAVNGVYTFDGIDGTGFFIGDSVDFDAVIDSLDQAFRWESSEGTYSTGIPSQAFLQATFSPLKGLRLRGLLHHEWYRGKHRSAMSLSATKDVGRVLTAGISYQLRNNRFDELGIHWQLNLGPIGFYFLSDNITALMAPKRAKHAQFRFGTNISI